MSENSTQGVAGGRAPLRHYTQALLHGESRMINVFLHIAGVVGFYVGIGNIIGSPWRVMDNAGRDGLLFNGLVFLLPGIVSMVIAQARDDTRTKALYKNMVDAATPKPPVSRAA